MKVLLTLAMIMSLTTAIGQSINVITYNIRYDNAGDGVNQWTKRTDKVYALVKKYNPDILGVQEALHHQVAGLLQNLPEYTAVGVGRDDGKTKGEYAAIFFRKDRFTLLEQNTFWLSETPDVVASKSWDAAITRIATWARLRDVKTGKEFIAVNTHFDHIGKEARAKSAALIKTRIAAFRKNLPIILTGDFNSEPSDLPSQEMINGKVLRLYNTRPASATQGTFCTFFVTDKPCTIIDYIFYSDGFTASDYEVITDNDGQHYPSDHLPVRSTLH
jgi:endonuclease/exonuclease/phosphatase family metal-dependent hydrolase